VEDLEGIFPSTVCYNIKSAVNNLLCDGLFTVLHHNIHELGDVSVTIFRVPHNRTLGYFATTRHVLILPLGVLGTLHTIFGATLTSVAHALGVQGTANDVVPNTWEVLDTTTADHHSGVLLEVVALTGDVGRDLNT
jgi:hypothetical protein